LGKSSEIVVKIVDEKYCVVTNKGTHHHGKPPAIHATQHGKDKLRQWVENNPGDKPINIMTGTPTKSPLWKDSQEKVFLNIDKVRQERKKILKSDSMKMKSVVPKDISSQIGAFDFSQIVAYDKETKLKFVIDSSLDGSDGGIIMQTPHMRTVLMNSQTASQTDSVEGFLYDPNLSSVNLAITSTFCHVREKWVATMYAILFGKTAEHYERYFRNLLEGYGFKSFDEFSENYMGMVCDFSDAERKGFKAALEKHFGISSDSYNVETFTPFVLCILTGRLVESTQIMP
jgi:hypothetical protein